MLTRRRKAALRKPRVEGKAPAKHALQLIRRDLDLVTVGVAEVDRVRNLVILEIEWNRAFLQRILRM